MTEESFIELKYAFQTEREAERQLLEKACGVALPHFRVDDPLSKYFNLQLSKLPKGNIKGDEKHG